MVIKKSNIEATYTRENLISMIAYLETYGDLVEIKDQNGLIIEDAVKVDVGSNYILVLRQDGSIYKYQIGVLTKITNVGGFTATCVI